VADSQGTHERPLERPLEQPADDEPREVDAGDESDTVARRSIRAFGGSHPARRAAWALAILVALTLLWIGGELHYQGCVEAASQRTPGDDGLSRLVRMKNIDDCSRLPF
jgi:hypothetical protein